MDRRRRNTAGLSNGCAMDTKADPDRRQDLLHNIYVQLWRSFEVFGWQMLTSHLDIPGRPQRGGFAYDPAVQSSGLAHLGAGR